jgi:glucokinase
MSADRAAGVGAGAAVTLGLDLGGTAIKWVALREEIVVASGSAPTPRSGAEAVVEAMAAVAVAAGPLEAVGVGVPGLFDPDGTSHGLHNVPGLKGRYPLGAALAGEVGAPVRLANDARSFTLAELRLGAGKADRHLVGVTLGTGIGGGVAVDGRVVLGRDNRAGELGHQTVDPQGALCGCGNRGCVETFASVPSILAGAARAVLQGVDTSLRAACGGVVSALTPVMVTAAAADGDPFARDVIDRAGVALGIGLANVCNIIAPERIVVGGGFAAALEILRPSLEETLRRRARPVGACPVVAAGLGQHAGAVGAALWTREPLR